MNGAFSLTGWSRAWAMAAALLAWATGGSAWCATHPADAGSPLQEVLIAERALERAAPLPEWADLAPWSATSARPGRAMVEVLVSEAQIHVGPPTMRLRHGVMRVNDTGALSEIGRVAIDYNPAFERLLLHRLWILRDGRTIDHTLSAPLRLLQRELRLEEGVYTGVVTASIVLPSVQVGDILQVVYTIVGDNPVLCGRFSRHLPWEESTPVGLRRVTLWAPPEREVRWRWFGGAGSEVAEPQVRLVGGLRQWRFQALDLPAGSAEPLMPESMEPLRHLQFTTHADWQSVARWAAAQFPSQPLPPELGGLVARLRAMPDPQERASQALQWVQDRVRHWSQAVGEDALRSRAPAVVLQRGWGDCKDKAQLLTTLLRAVDIEAHPVLTALVARHDPAAMLPAPEMFDHVIVRARVGGRDHFVDPTRRGQSGLLSRMGQRFEGRSVLVVDDRTTDLVTVSSPNRAEIFLSRTHERIRVPDFDADADAELDVRMQWNGLDAEALRLSLRAMDEAQRSRFVVAGYQEQYPGSRLLAPPEVRDDTRNNQLTIEARLAVPNLVRPLGGDRWAVPFSTNLGDVVPLPASLQRRFPLFMAGYPTTRCYRIDVTWPQSVAPEPTPQSQRMDTPHWRLLTARRVEGNTETRTVEFSPRVAQVPAAEVPAYVEDVSRMAARIGYLMFAKGRLASSTLAEPRSDASSTGEEPVASLCGP